MIRNYPLRNMVRLRNLITCYLIVISSLGHAQDSIPIVEQTHPVVFNPKSPPVHDPVMAKDGDTYYVFGTGKGISTLYSKDLVNWKQGKPVFDKVPEWTQEAL